MERAASLLRMMREERVPADAYTYNSILAACADALDPGNAWKYYM